VAMLKRILKSVGRCQMNEIAPSKKAITTGGTGGSQGITEMFLEGSPARVDTPRFD
jgi:hypothetical protein